MKKCPCEQCPCIPICRHRMYVQLVRSCHLWKEYVNFRKDHAKDKKSMSDHREKFLVVYNVLKPKRWFIHREDSKYGYMIQTIPEGADRSDPKYKSQI